MIIFDVRSFQYRTVTAERTINNEHKAMWHECLGEAGTEREHNSSVAGFSTWRADIYETSPSFSGIHETFTQNFEACN